MTWRQWLIVSMLLGPVYTAALIGAYWAWWPIEPTMRVIYSHPKFCSAPCFSREEAKLLETDAVVSGTEAVWHFREIEITAERIGAIRAVWVSDAFVWNSPQIPTIGSKPGHYARSVAIIPPTSSPTRTFIWRTAFYYDLTPMRSEVVEFPPVQLTVTAK